MAWIDQLLTLARWKRLIIGNTLVVAVLSVVVALLLPNWYRSTATLFPPEEESFGLGSLSSLVAISALGAGRSHLPVWASPSDVYAAVLASRTVMETIIERFDLMEVYDVDNLDVAIKILRTHVQIKIGGEGIVFVHVEDKDAERAAAMANAFVEELDAINRTKRHTAAGQARRFLDERMARFEVEMRAAEEELRRLQEETGILDPEEQVRAAVRALTDLETQLVVKEVELGLLEARLGPGHPDRSALEREVSHLRAKLTELEEGADGERTSLREMPALSLRWVRAYREVKVQETIGELLRQQYETYRIQEERDTPTVYVLDQARPAEKKFRPKRSILCISATLLAFAASVALALTIEALGRIRGQDPERFARLRRLAGELRLGWLIDRAPEP